MTKEKRILSYFIGWLLVGYIILFIGTNNVFAATYDTFDVTWYYRNKSNESNLLNVTKNQDTALYASTNEYVNGYTTRIEQTFTKQIQYIVNYQLQMWFSPEQELNYRSDTLQRIIDYSYTDSDFKILNVIANENWNRSSSSGDTLLTINVSMQILALNNTDAIRFGVYTNNNISIGFYNHTDQIDYYLVNNISIEENANATIIDQNNQIIAGQDGINNNITNSTNTITGTITDTENNINSNIQSSQDNINQNIDDMENAIVDSNNQTQEVIKDQFNSCRPSVNLADPNLLENGALNGATGLPIQSDVQNQRIRTKQFIEIKKGTYTINAENLEIVVYRFDINKVIYNEDKNISWKNTPYTFTLYEDGYITYALRKANNSNLLPNEIFIQLEKGTTANSNEPYGEICSNKIDDTNNKLDGIQGALTDSSAPNTSGLENSAGWLPAGPLDSILNLPLTMLNSLTNSLGKTCAPLNLRLPYVNKNIQIPCLSAIFAQITGVNDLWTWVGTIASVLILYNYLLNLYAWVDRVLTLRAEFDEAMGADMANWGRL